MLLKVSQFLMCFNLLLLAGCYEKTTSDGETIVCDTAALPAIVVDVFDRETGFANACGATVMIEDGDFIEQLDNPLGDECDESFSFNGAHERDGIYNITVTKEGYQQWQQFDVVVSEGLCHVNTISLQAYMERQ
jgi:hypothetical protein